MIQRKSASVYERAVTWNCLDKPLLYGLLEVCRESIDTSHAKGMEGHDRLIYFFIKNSIDVGPIDGEA